MRSSFRRTSRARTCCPCEREELVRRRRRAPPCRLPPSRTDAQDPTGATSIVYRIAIIATDPMTADRLMEGQLAYLGSHGFDVIVITAPGPKLKRVGEREGVRAIG